MFSAGYHYAWGTSCCSTESDAGGDANSNWAVYEVKAEYCYESFTGTGSDYAGCQSFTRTGRTCQAWASQSPHAHAYGSHTTVMSNYCRNPDGARDTIWCFTTDSQ
eukprot:gene3125-3962_t